MGKAAAKKSEMMQSEAANRYSKMASDLYGESLPQRQTVGNYYQGIIQGGPQAQAVTAPQISYLKRQTNAAQQQIRDTLPQGGAQQRALRDLAVQAPGQKANIYQSQIKDALDRLQQLGTFNTGGALQATGGVSQAGQALGNLAAQRGAAVAGGLGALGTAGGAAIGKWG